MNSQEFSLSAFTGYWQLTTGKGLLAKDDEVKRIGWLAAFLALWITVSPASAIVIKGRHAFNRLSRRLHGAIEDYTHNHGADRRIWSAALNQPRDLYVYLPPGFDPSHQYPAMIWMHGFSQDERSFLNYIVEPLDKAMASGQLPPMIVAAPDGSLKGRPSLMNGGSFFINSDAGNFEDYLAQDVWGFLVQNYPIRPEREAHVLAGLSMGGFAAFNLGIKYQETFKNVIGVMPPLNLRWVDCHCRYMRNFDPCCWGWRTQVDTGFEVIGRFFGGLISIRLKQVIDPLYGRGPEALAAVSRENPIEMIDAFGLQDGALDMYVAYVRRDQFNIDAQVESFLYRAGQRGISVDVGYSRWGRHNMRSAKRLYPNLFDWLAARLEPYGPGKE